MNTNATGAAPSAAGPVGIISVVTHKCKTDKRYKYTLLLLWLVLGTWTFVRAYNLHQVVSFPPRTMETIAFRRDHSWWFRNISVPRRLYNAPDKESIDWLGRRSRVFEVAVDSDVVKFKCIENERVYVELID